MPDRAIEELVVLSHLRWVWVRQRPQHLISRLGRGLPTSFVEEPWCEPSCARPGLRRESLGEVERIWYEVPGDDDWVSFTDPRAASYGAELAERFPPRPGRVLWIYTAMALGLVDVIPHDVLVYDVMDDLASFKGAPPEQRLRHHAALHRADVVFTGGRSLHRGVVSIRADGVHCFPSGVEPDHYAPAVDQRPVGRQRPVAGYVGVIDERLDMGLLADLAAALPDWDLHMVGPVAKIDPLALPSAENIHWLGRRDYADLPAVLADFDVALMPFALNEATRSISPTKTLEYMAAGLPIVSTRVPDVVADYSEVVAFGDDGARFAERCIEVLAHDRRQRYDAFAPLLHRQHWDTIAGSMRRICEQHLTARRAERSPGLDASDKAPA
jgi:glycosyltransferase involved in cell wall biosynthesis